MSRLIILFYILKVVCAGGNSYVDDDLPISSTLSEKSLISEENVQNIEDELIEIDEEEEIAPRNLDDDYDAAPRTSSPKPILHGRELTEIEQKSPSKTDVKVSLSEPLQSLSRKISRRLVKKKEDE